MSEQRQFIKYTFFKLDRKWRKLSEYRREAYKKGFIKLIKEFSERVKTFPYSLIGLKADSDFLLWNIAENVEDLQEFFVRLFKTDLAKYLITTYSYLAMSKPSEYIENHKHSDAWKIKPQGWKYLIVYPMVKKREWYTIPFEERLKMMKEHAIIGGKYPRVRNNTAYSFGLDDQEFVVAFEAESLSDFLDLVLELRASKASQYTERDTPIFSCLKCSLEELMSKL